MISTVSFNCELRHSREDLECHFQLLLLVKEWSLKLLSDLALLMTTAHSPYGVHGVIPSDPDAWIWSISLFLSKPYFLVVLFVSPDATHEGVRGSLGWIYVCTLFCMVSTAVACLLLVALFFAVCLLLLHILRFYFV